MAYFNSRKTIVRMEGAAGNGMTFGTTSTRCFLNAYARGTTSDSGIYSHLPKPLAFSQRPRALRRLRIRSRERAENRHVAVGVNEIGIRTQRIERAVVVGRGVGELVVSSQPTVGEVSLLPRDIITVVTTVGEVQMEPIGPVGNVYGLYWNPMPLGVELTECCTCLSGTVNEVDLGHIPVEVLVGAWVVTPDVVSHILVEVDSPGRIDLVGLRQCNGCAVDYHLKAVGAGTLIAVIHTMDVIPRRRVSEHMSTDQVRNGGTAGDLLELEDVACCKA